MWHRVLHGVTGENLQNWQKELNQFRENYFEAPVCQEWINGAHKKVRDYVK